MALQSRVATCILFFASISTVAHALNIVIPGGTGTFGRALIPNLADHDVTVLSRNSFLASAPARVTEVFGYLGESFLRNHPYTSIRDWDGGDLLDIVGQDWVGWQEDTLQKADIVIHLVGGYTEQRTMATERIVRESLRVNPNALQIAVNPTEDDIPILTPGLPSLKKERIQKCEDMVKINCMNSACLRLEAYKMDESIEAICKTVAEWKT